MAQCALIQGGADNLTSLHINAFQLLHLLK